MANRLADSTSPYLRQHADNPVDWYQWGDQAFAAAADRDVPLLISIGYSSCHWCHVMAHESFEDPEVAAAMNRHFVNIKVDREERPDIDAVYMEATQTMTGRGGWPMTVLATPDGRPFYCGTYFPPEPRQGMPSFTQLIEALADAWATKRDELEGQADTLSEAITRSAPLEPDAPAPELVTIDEAVLSLAHAADAQWGGFGVTPKFPQPASVDLLTTHAIGHLLSIARSASTWQSAAWDPRRPPPNLTDRQYLPHFEDGLTTPSDPSLPARLAADRRGSLPPDRRGDDRLPARRAAAAGGSVRLRPGRRQPRSRRRRPERIGRPGRRGPLRHLDPGRTGGGARRGRRRQGGRLLGHHRGGQL
jgi:hypothetical protein